MSQCHSNAWPRLQDIPLNTVQYHAMLPSLQHSTRWTDSSHQLALIRSKHIQYLKRHLVWCDVEREIEGEIEGQTDSRTDRRTDTDSGRPLDAQQLLHQLLVCFLHKATLVKKEKPK